MGLLSHGFGGEAETSTDPVVERGVRFNSGDYHYLSLVPSGASDREKFTFSFWIKRTALGGTTKGVFNYNSGSNYIVFDTDDMLQITMYDEGDSGNYLQVRTLARFRDTSAWQHLCLSVDSTTNTVTFWINGTAYTNWDTGWGGHSLSVSTGDFGWGESGETIYIGAGNGVSEPGDHLLADFYCLDGTIKTAADFGEANSNGLWVPKATSFTSSEYGTAGVHLDFNGGHDSEFLLQSDHPDDSDNFEDSSGPRGHYVETDSGGVTHQDTVGNPFGSGSAVYFDGSSSPYLQFGRLSDEWTFGTGDFTVECWVRCTNLTGSTFQSIAGITEGSVASSLHPAWNLRMNNGALQWYRYDGTTETTYTSQSSVISVDTWHHVAVTRDSSSDKFKFFVDGVDESGTSGGHDDTIDYTLQSGYGTQDLFMGKFTYGAGGGSTDYLYGYIYDLRITKGEARYTADFDVPTAPFESSILHPGGDSSTKKNHFHVETISYGDVMRDCSEGGENFCTLNPLASPVASDLSEGNLKVSTSGATRYRTLSTIRIPSSGKWYFECYRPSGNGWTFGLSKEADAHDTEWGNDGGLSGWYQTTTNHIYPVAGSSGMRYGDTYENASKIFQIAIDADSGKVYYGKGDGTDETVNEWSNDSVGSMNSSGSFASFDADTPTEIIDDIDEYFVCLGCVSGTAPILNAGQDGSFAGNYTGTLFTAGGGEWAFEPPTGFKALKTENLPPSPNVDDSFKTVTYTGNGSSGHGITGVGFQPDLVIIKNRDGGDGNVFDSTRGVHKYFQLYSASVYDDSTTLTSFDSDGFTLGDSSDMNSSSTQYVAWCFKKDASAGLDIVSYAGNGSSTRDISHSLGSTPKFVWVQQLSSGSYSACWHEGLSGGDYYFNNQYSESQDSSVFRAAPTSSVIKMGDSSYTNYDGDDYIMYVWGGDIFKTGKYAGNSSSDGPFVFCGGQPHFLMVMPRNTTNSWPAFDTVREGYNPMNDYLQLGNTDPESAGDILDLISNGFKPTASNTQFNETGYDYCWLAAVQPLKNSNAR